MKQRREQAFTLTELVVTTAVLLIIAAMFLPALASAKKKSSRISCINNLKQIDLSFKIWANDNRDKYPTHVSTANGGAMESAEQGMAYRIFQVMSNEVNTPKLLICETDPKHTFATSFLDLRNANISYFVGLDADESAPRSMLLGDSNLALDEKPVPPGILSVSANTRVGWTDERTTKFHMPGNVAFADGSAEGFYDRDLRKSFETITGTNRLVIP